MQWTSLSGVAQPAQGGLEDGGGTYTIRRPGQPREPSYHYSVGCEAVTATEHWTMADVTYC
eukprot:2137758-Pyramimonas_sp.AAC.1